MQERSGGMSPEQAGKLAAAQQRINQQREAISELKNRRAQKKVMAGYEGKLREMTICCRGWKSRWRGCGWSFRIREKFAG